MSELDAYLCNRLVSDSEPAGKDNTQFRPRKGRMTKANIELKISFI